MVDHFCLCWGVRWQAARIARNGAWWPVMANWEARCRFSRFGYSYFDAWKESCRIASHTLECQRSTCRLKSCNQTVRWLRERYTQVSRKMSLTFHPMCPIFSRFRNRWFSKNRARLSSNSAASGLYGSNCSSGALSIPKAPEWCRIWFRSLRNGHFSTLDGRWGRHRRSMAL